tara:strand:+ start:203 stop:889 length:687 start_codon:yes stop_codon:yes gene_type:complete
MKIIAIIPARENSKRIPHKNLLKLNKTPILKILYNNLKKMNIFSKIIVSSESPKIRKLALNIGYDFAVKRPNSLSKDLTPSHLAINHSINYLQNKFYFSHACCVYPMAILLKKKDFLSAKKILKKNNEIVFPSLKYSHPIQRAFKIKKDFSVKYNLSKIKISKNTQSFSENYHDAGQFYIGHKKAWKNYEISRKKSIELSSLRAVDVDNLEDFEVLKSKFFYQKNKII